MTVPYQDRGVAEQLTGVIDWGQELGIGVKHGAWVHDGDVACGRVKNLRGKKLILSSIGTLLVSDQYAFQHPRQYFIQSDSYVF